MTPSPLIDTFGRTHNNLRISVTDRCNIRCFYCMPENDVQFVDRREILSFEEIERLPPEFRVRQVHAFAVPGLDAERHLVLIERA